MVAEARAKESAKQTNKLIVDSSKGKVLAYYDLHKPVVLQADASDYALGGVLLLPNDNGKLQTVAFTSSSMSLTEQSYYQTEKECLTICNCS